MALALKTVAASKSLLPIHSLEPRSLNSVLHASFSFASHSFGIHTHFPTSFPSDIRRTTNQKIQTIVEKVERKYQPPH